MKPELLVKRIVYHGDLGKSIIQFCWKYAEKQEVDTVENFLTAYGRMLKSKKHTGNMYPSYEIYERQILIPSKRKLVKHPITGKYIIIIL